MAGRVNDDSVFTIGQKRVPLRSKIFVGPCLNSLIAGKIVDAETFGGKEILDYKSKNERSQVHDHHFEQYTKEFSLVTLV